MTTNRSTASERLTPGIRDFVTKYTAADYKLTVNHRCGRKVLSWAESVIQRDYQRGAKAAVTPGPANKDGEVAYLEFASEVTEARGIASAIKILHDRRGVPYNEILVLTRTDNVSKPIGKELSSQGIPFKYPDELAAGLDEPSVRLSLATLRLAGNREDSVAWWTILHLAAGVGVSAVDALMASARDSRSLFGTHLLALTASQDIDRIAGKRAAGVVRATLDALQSVALPEQGPWGTWIEEQVRAGRVPAIPDDVLALLLEIDKLTEPSIGLERYIAQLRPMTKDLATTLKAEAVRVMTMASSKGLTARACIIAGCEDNIIPHPLARREEELRLLYVAMTRPQEYLFITRARTRRGMTARVGRASVRDRRTICPFLEGGPVAQQDGASFLGSLA
jgi:DNA helicase-2/ATP-dependent DNA helicase PcrA